MEELNQPTTENIDASAEKLEVQENSVPVSPEVAELMQRYAEQNIPQTFTKTTYKRYLAGHKGDADTALAGLIKYAHWRIENGADTITAEDCGEYITKRVTYSHGFEKQGRPTIYTIIGKHDAYDREPKEVFKFIIYILDLMLKRAKPEDEQIVSVFDMTAFSMRNMDYECLKVFIDILQGFYPEILGQLYVCNAPFIFYACWAIIRLWLDPVTASKVRFINLDQLGEFIDDDQMSPGLGLSADEL